MVTSTPIGEQIEATETVMKCFARINGGAGKEGSGDGRFFYEKEKTFKVRYCKALAELNSMTMRITYQDKAYDVTDIDDYMERHEFLTFRGKLRE